MDDRSKEIKPDATAENEPKMDVREPGERVYAPASARVAKPPAPGHEGLVAHVDESTPERSSAAEAEDAPRSEEERAD